MKFIKLIFQIYVIDKYQPIEYVREENGLYGLTIPELKNILKQHKLKIGGKKRELIDRIMENIYPLKYETVTKLVPV